MSQSWKIVAITVLALLASGVLLRGTGWPLLGHAVFTPLILYVAVRGEIAPKYRNIRGPVREWMAVTAFTFGFYVVCIPIGFVLFILLIGAFGYFIEGVTVRFIYIAMIIPVLSWFVALLFFGLALPAIAMDEWDEGLVGGWRSGRRQRRWLAGRMSAGPLPIFAASLVIAVWSGLWTSDRDASPLSQDQIAAASMIVLCIQAYAIAMAGVVLGRAYLRDHNLTADVVDTFA